MYKRDLVGSGGSGLPDQPGLCDKDEGVSLISSQTRELATASLAVAHILVLAVVSLGPSVCGDIAFRETRGSVKEGRP